VTDRSIYYDRQGRPLTREEFCTSFENREALEAARRVAETTLLNGRWVSTVWIGIDMNFGTTGAPLIFETMVFESSHDLRELDVDRYSTEADALAGHARLVALWSRIEDGTAILDD
jgi:hypothetical protein